MFFTSWIYIWGWTCKKNNRRKKEGGYFVGLCIKWLFDNLGWMEFIYNGFYLNDCKGNIICFFNIGNIGLCLSGFSWVIWCRWRFYMYFKGFFYKCAILFLYLFLCRILNEKTFANKGYFYIWLNLEKITPWPSAPTIERMWLGKYK